MRKITKLLFLLTAFVAWGSVVYAQNNDCNGTSTETSTPAQGTFTLGYNYSFTTSGTDVILTFELLDNQTGVVAYAWTYNPAFAETSMTLVSGKKFTKTFSGQTIGATFNVACKFAFSGGMAVTKTFTYIVGNDCGMSTDVEAPTAFTAVAGTLTKNSVELLLKATDNNGGAITYTISYGSVPTVLTTTGTSGIQKSYTVTGLTATTNYTFSITAKDAAGNITSNSPIQVPATTLTPEFTLTTSPAASGGTTVDNLTDGIASTNWSVATKTVSYLTFTYATPREFNTITLTSGANTGRNPKDWTLKASNDTIANGWTTLDTQTGQVFATTTTVKTYSFTNTTAYKYYRFHTTAVNGSSSTTNLGELALSKIILVAQPPTGFTATTGTIGSNNVELLLNATVESGTINYTITYGAEPTVLQTSGTSGVQKSFIVTGLNPSTQYNFSIVSKNEAGNAAVNSPIVVNATTTAAPSLSTVNFETVGQDWAWTLFENGDNAPSLYSVVSNPSASGVNTSANVAKYIVNSSGQPWAGLWSDNLPDFTFTADNCIVKVMVYKDVISNFDVKFEGDGGLNFEKQIPNTKINEWEELIFDFSNRIGSTVTRLVLIPDFPGTRTAGSTNYFDNISFSSGVPPVVLAPATPAPTPNVNPSKVISMFSDSYTNVSVDTWRTSWSSGGILTDLQIVGNNTKKYADLGFIGVETTGSFINANAMTHFHVDYWSADVTKFYVKLVDFGADAAWGGGDDVEQELSFTPTASTWNSINIPLTDFTGLVTKAHLAQYILKCDPYGTGNVYIDNMYFYDGTATSLNSVENVNLISIYPNPVKDELSINSKSEINQVIVRNLVGQTVKSTLVNGLVKSIDLSGISAGNYLVTIKLSNGQVSNQKLVKL